MREVSADRKPRPPKCSGSCVLLVARTSNNGGESLARNSHKLVAAGEGRRVFVREKEVVCQADHIA